MQIMYVSIVSPEFVHD